MFIKPIEEYALSRRQVLRLGGSAVVTTLLCGLPSLDAEASPKEAKLRLADIAKGAKLQKGRIKTHLR